MATIQFPEQARRAPAAKRRPKTAVQLRMDVTSMEQVALDACVLQELVHHIMASAARYRQRTWIEQSELAEVRRRFRDANEILRAAKGR